MHLNASKVAILVAYMLPSASLYKVPRLSHGSHCVIEPAAAHVKALALLYTGTGRHTGTAYPHHPNAIDSHSPAPPADP